MSWKKKNQGPCFKNKSSALSVDNQFMNLALSGSFIDLVLLNMTKKILHNATKQVRILSSLYNCMKTLVEENRLFSLLKEHNLFELERHIPAHFIQELQKKWKQFLNIYWTPYDR